MNDDWIEVGRPRITIPLGMVRYYVAYNTTGAGVAFCFGHAQFPDALADARIDVAWSLSRRLLRLTPAPSGRLQWIRPTGNRGRCLAAGAITSLLHADGISLSGDYPYRIDGEVIYISIPDRDAPA